MSLPLPVTARERFVRWQPRFALCAVCRGPAHGFGWQEPQRVSRPRPAVWFCSTTCQSFFWQRARRSSAMVDLTEEEKAAIRKAMKLVAETMEEIGWHVRLDSLSEQQVFTIIEVAVGGFQEVMRDIAKSNDNSPEVPF
jgi:hypothetical protein